MAMHELNRKNGPGSARFWECGRIIYNLVLLSIVVLWIALSWPHFRPSLTWSSLVAMLVLGVLANLCYSAAYLADLCIRAVLPGSAWLRGRRIIFALGTIAAIAFTNYWIADEIYPYANQPPKLF